MYLFSRNKRYVHLILICQILTFHIRISYRGAILTGYLPHEMISQAIFNFVYRDDHLVVLHALWKCNLKYFSLTFD